MSALKISILFLFLSVSALAKDAGFTRLTVYDGLPSSAVYHVMQDSKGFMWFCTETGVSRYDGRKFELFTIADGLADNENFKSFEDSKGRIWFLSYNGKLSYYQYGKVCNAANASWLNHSFNNGSLLDIAEDKFGNIWITKRKKVNKA